MSVPAVPFRIDAASGAARGPDAAGEAAAQALESLGGEAALLLAFPSGLDPERVAAEVTAAGAPLAGMTGSGAICNSGVIESGCAVLAFGAGTPVGLGVRTRASRGLRDAARAATAEAIGTVRQAGADGITVLLFLDTRSGDQAEGIAGAYAAAGPRIPLVGGGAGGDQPAQLAAGRAHADAVVAVAIGAARPAGVGLAHGCRVHGMPSIATRSRGRALLEIDGRPADQVYLERLAALDPDLGEEEFHLLAVTHPLAQPELRGESRLRHVLGREPGGGLACATHIPANAAIEFTEQGAEDIVGSSRRAVRSALARMPVEPRAALIFDCAGRKRAAGPSLDLEAGALIAAFGPAPPPLAGLYSHGEVLRLRGAKGDRNHAVVVAAFA